MPLSVADTVLRASVEPGNSTPLSPRQTDDDYRRNGYASEADAGGGAGRPSEGGRMLLKHIALQLEKIQDIAEELDLEARLGNLEDLDDRLARIEARLSRLEDARDHGSTADRGRRAVLGLPEGFEELPEGFGSSFTGRVDSRNSGSKTIELAALRPSALAGAVRFQPPGWPGILRNSAGKPSPTFVEDGPASAAVAAAKHLSEEIKFPDTTPRNPWRRASTRDSRQFASLARQDTLDYVRSSSGSLDSLPQSFNTNRATVKKLARRIVADKSSTQKTFFKETVWEASILLGVHGTGSVGSIFIAVGLSANLLVQFVFCLLLLRIIKKPFPDESVEGFLRWRLTQGHSWSNVDRDTWVSLVSRLCNRDPSLALSEKQDTMLEWIDDYLEPFMVSTTGTMMVTLTIIIWALIVFKELWEAFHFMQAVANLPKGVTRFVPTRDDELRLVAIGNKRFMFMMAVSAARIFIALALLVLGSNLLAFTAELQEVVLNAVALAFVMECDELIFANFIPLSTKVILRSLVPLTRQTRVYRGVDATPAVNTIAIGVFAFVVLFVWVLPMGHTMRLGRDHLCAGNLDFAVAEQGATGMIVSTNTSRYVRGFERLGRATTTWADLVNDWNVSNWVVAVHELVAQNPPTMSVFQPSQRLFESRVAQTMEQMTQNVVRCEDWDFEGQRGELLPFLLTLQNTTRIDNATRCEDFAARCRQEEAALLRHACPVTCGCRSPRSGLLLNGQRFGCPRQACHASEEYLRELDAPPACDDLSLDELAAEAGWRDFVEQLAGLSATAQHDCFEPDTMLMLADAAWELERLGCEAVAERTQIRETFCGDMHHSYSSLHAFCPEACGCRSSPSKDCPRACRQEDTSDMRLFSGREV